MPPRAAEVQVCRAFLAAGELLTPPDYAGGYGVRQVSELVAEIEAAQAEGVPVLLLRLDSLGGHLEALWAAFEALLRFQEAGGVVVCHVEGWAASSAAILPLACRYVLVAPGARVFVHGAFLEPGDQGDAPRNAQEAAMVAEEQAVWVSVAGDLLASKTYLDRREARSWLARPVSSRNPGGQVLDAKACVAAGYADAVASSGKARRFAAALPLGPAPTPRQERLVGDRTPTVAKSSWWSADPDLLLSATYVRGVGATQLEQAKARRTPC